MLSVCQDVNVDKRLAHQDGGRAGPFPLAYRAKTGEQILGVEPEHVSLCTLAERHETCRNAREAIR